MQNLLVKLVYFISRIHNYIIDYFNNRHLLNLTDKQMHFIIMGLLGMGIFILTFAVFKFIEKHFKPSVFLISFIYTFTVLVVITFAIEIGQKVTNTGNMEFADILYGLWGFLLIFGVLVLICGIVWLIKKIIAAIKEK